MIIYYTDRYTGGKDASHELLAEAFAAYTGDAGRARALTGEIRKGEHGKPYIDGFSCFSISHTGKIWAVLIAGCECGLDIQTAKVCNMPAIARRWFAEEDSKRIADLCSRGDADAGAEFFRIWTRREAMVKALGGTVYDTGLPAVTSDTVAVCGKILHIRDISIPGLADVFASVCTEEECSGSDIGFQILNGARNE